MVIVVMMLTTITLLIIGRLFVATPCDATVNLSSDPSLILGSQCQSVEITCQTRNLQFFEWFRDNPMDSIVIYSYRSGVFPMTIHNSSGIVIQVITAVQETNSLEFNATSVLTTTTAVLDMLNVTSIHCGNRVDSQTIPVMVNVKAAPPPSFSCSITSSSNSLKIFIQWNSSYTSQYSVERYSVWVPRDPSFCSSDQISPSSASLYSCPELIQGSNYDFIVSALSTCGNLVQESERSSFGVEPQVPQPISEVSVEPLYNEDAELSQVRVHWSEPSQPHISEKCTVRLNYTISLIDSARVTVEERFVTSESCRSGLCSTIFENFNSSLDYQVSVETRNGLGRASSNVTSVTISGLAVTLLLLEFDFDSCLITAFCISSETIGNCSIQYSPSPSQDDLSEPIQDSLNFPLLEPNTVYYYVATVTINSSFTFLRIGNFSTGQFAPRLTTTYVVLMAIGVVALAIAIIFALIIFILEMVTKQGSWLSLVLLLVGVFLLVVCVALWIAVSVVVIPQDNTCDSKWQSQRNALIISAMVCSLVALLVLVTATIFLCFAIRSIYGKPLKSDKFYKKILISRKSIATEDPTLISKEVPTGRKDIIPKPTTRVTPASEKTLELRDLGPEDLQVRGAGGRFKVVEERNLVDEFVPQGKHVTHRSQILQLREQDHKVVEAAFSETKKPGSAMPSEGEVQEQQYYSSLQHKPDKKSKSETPVVPSKEYSTLDHKKGAISEKGDQAAHTGTKQQKGEYSALSTDWKKGNKVEKPGEHATNETEEYSIINLDRQNASALQDERTSHAQNDSAQHDSQTEDGQQTLNPDKQFLDLFRAKANSCRACYWKEPISDAEALKYLQKYNYNAIKAMKEIHQDCKNNITKRPIVPPNFIKKTTAELKKATKELRTRRGGIAAKQHITFTGHGPSGDEQLKRKERFEQFLKEANIVRRKYGRRPLTDAEGYNFFEDNMFDTEKAMEIITIRSSVTQKFLKDVNALRKKYRKDELGKQGAYEYLKASKFDEDKALQAISMEGSDLLTFFEKANVIRKQHHKVDLTEAEAYKIFDDCGHDINKALSKVNTDAKKPGSWQRGNKELQMDEDHFEMPEHRRHPKSKY